MAVIQGVPKHDPTFFKFVKPGTLLFSMCLWTVLGIGVFKPNAFPYKSLGPIGEVYRYVAIDNPAYVYWAFYGSIIFHILGSIYGQKLAIDRGITDFTTQLKWFAQNIVFGFLSWRLIQEYQPKLSD